MAACGILFTFYITESGKVIFCHVSKIGEKNINPTYQASYFGHWRLLLRNHRWRWYNFHPRQKWSAFRSHKILSLISAIGIVCCIQFICALTVDCCVFANWKLNNDSPDFDEVLSLRGKKIEKISGCYDTCVALSRDGRAFICRDNCYGQFGNGKKINNYSDFTEIQIN